MKKPKSPMSSSRTRKLAVGARFTRLRRLVSAVVGARGAGGEGCGTETRGDIAAGRELARADHTVASGVERLQHDLRLLAVRAHAPGAERTASAETSETVHVERPEERRPFLVQHVHDVEARIRDVVGDSDSNARGPRVGRARGRGFDDRVEIETAVVTEFKHYRGRPRRGHSPIRSRARIFGDVAQMPSRGVRAIKRIRKMERTTVARGRRKHTGFEEARGACVRDRYDIGRGTGVGREGRRVCSDRERCVVSVLVCVCIRHRQYVRVNKNGGRLIHGQYAIAPRYVLRCVVCVTVCIRNHDRIGDAARARRCEQDADRDPNHHHQTLHEILRILFLFCKVFVTARTSHPLPRSMILLTRQGVDRSTAEHDQPMSSPVHMSWVARLQTQGFLCGLRFLHLA